MHTDNSLHSEQVDGFVLLNSLQYLSSGQSVVAEVAEVAAVVVVVVSVLVAEVDVPVEVVTVVVDVDWVVVVVEVCVMVEVVAVVVVAVAVVVVMLVVVVVLLSQSQSILWPAKARPSPVMQRMSEYKMESCRVERMRMTNWKVVVSRGCG